MSEIIVPSSKTLEHRFMSSYIQPFSLTSLKIFHFERVLNWIMCFWNVETFLKPTQFVIYNIIWRGNSHLYKYFKCSLFLFNSCCKGAKDDWDFQISDLAKSFDGTDI